MKIAIDISPLETGHSVRGVGFYLKNLIESLKKYFPENEYIFFKDYSKLVGNFDLIHFPYFDPFFINLPFFKKYKTVVTVHDLTPIVFKNNFPAGIKGNLKWEINKILLKRVDSIITDSDSSTKDVINLIGFDRNKVNTVYLAAGEEFKIQNSEVKIKEVKKRYNLPEKFGLYVGDVTWNKNLPRVIEAFKKTEIPLVMIGKALVEENFDHNNSWNSDRIKVLELTKNNNQFIRLGFIPTEDLVSIYNIATFSITASLYEGFGLPVIEAMDCGCPVIASQEGSIPETTGDGAVFIDAYSINSIAEGISKVFKNKDLQKDLSKRGLEQAKKFSWEKTAKETIAIYKQILNK